MAHVEENGKWIHTEEPDGFSITPEGYIWTGKRPLAYVPTKIVFAEYPEFRMVGPAVVWKFGKRFELRGLGTLYIVEQDVRPPWCFIAARRKLGLLIFGSLYRVLRWLSYKCTDFAARLIYDRS